MQKQLTKGNEAIVKAAVLAGCRAYYGYPITPASEIAEAASRDLRRAGGVFVQAESEVAAINMLSCWWDLLPGSPRILPKPAGRPSSASSLSPGCWKCGWEPFWRPWSRDGCTRNKRASRLGW